MTMMKIEVGDTGRVLESVEGMKGEGKKSGEQESK